MTAEVIIKGDRAGTSPGLRQPPEPEQGELRRTPVEIEGPYFRLGAPERSRPAAPDLWRDRRCDQTRVGPRSEQGNRALGGPEHPAGAAGRRAHRR